ncbi:MAG: hypothetical protein JOZ98_19930 [Solirubrobacterales bacterium]|nr:hypothetical protein [Solirubrobacterales bacterium]
MSTRKVDVAVVEPAAAVAQGSRRWRTAAVLSLLLLACGAVVAAPAQASAVYNNTTQSYGMQFDCGLFCGQDFKVASNDTWGWPGEAGTYRINDQPNGVGCEADDGQVGVPDHGYSVLRSTGPGAKDIVWDDYRADNSVTARGVNIVVSGLACTPLGARSRAHVRCTLPPRRAALVRRWFLTADRNHDGVIDRAEARRAIVADFRRIDVDRDGAVTLKDIGIDFRRIGRPPVVKPSLAYYFPFHKARGGSIRLVEFERAMVVRAGRMDRNRDGRYSWREVRAFYTQRFGRCRPVD